MVVVLAPRAGQGTIGVFAPPVDEVVWDLAEEAAGGISHRIAPRRAQYGTGKIQLLASAGNAHIGEAALLAQLLRVTQ